ncbi:MAG: hypothetical protein M3505_10975 [Verrucomicrobiota bacterium]|nr:hypothetical protein [Verrucomicrobiota bacterium]
MSIPLRTGEEKGRFFSTSETVFHSGGGLLVVNRAGSHVETTARLAEARCSPRR